MSTLDELYDRIWVERITRLVGGLCVLGAVALVALGARDGRLTGTLIFGVPLLLYGLGTAVWPRRGAGFVWWLFRIVPG